MKIIPTGNTLLLRVNLPKDLQSEYIEIPEETIIKYLRNTYEGEVLAVGTRCWKDIDAESPDAKVGDMIMHVAGAGVDKKPPKGEKGYYYRIINDLDVIARIVED